MQIRSGTQILTGAIAAGIICLVAINIYGVRLIDELQQFDELSRDIRDNVFDLNILANELGVRRSARVERQFESRLSGLHNLFDSLETHPKVQPSVLRRMKRSAAGLQIFFERLESLESGPAMSGTDARGRRAVIQSFLGASQTLSDLARRLSRGSADSILKIEADIKLLSTIALVVTILLLSGVYGFIVFTVLRPIVALHEKVVGMGPLNVAALPEKPVGNELKMISAELDSRLEAIRMAETRLQNKARELQRSNSDLEEFAYIASHDLKEPIRAISNHAQFLFDDHNEVIGEDGSKRIGRIRELCKKSEGLISALLEFSRIGRSEEAVQRIDLAETIDIITVSLADYLTECNATVDIVTALPPVFGDPSRIQSVFQNLIVNGVKYNDRDEKRIEIGYEEPVGDEPGKFYVKDNGIGIPEEFQERVFTIFKRLHNDRAYGPGSGTGLSFVRKIVERHGGKITVESREGEGSKFIFNLREAG
ncbi:hypothetical protein EOI86_15520 [Hwanghaeella grinnelliae]|uniref:histidine kinase n=1 Tax=Hwanghaeella grinnelliae TaxID=2500179 RepID=A0A3S2W9K7_9PROT|nr:ATP-binding protein [Hwanghaeella grinnelliae]RVU36593.1 hypothetical protein EOI86_15520 [Hwanghaeella grinnelliae]